MKDDLQRTHRFLSVAREIAYECLLEATPGWSETAKKRAHESFINGANDHNLGVRCALAALLRYGR